MSLKTTVCCDVCEGIIGDVYEGLIDSEASYAWVDASVYSAHFCAACVAPAIEVLCALGLDDIQLRRQDHSEDLIRSSFAKSSVAKSSSKRRPKKVNAGEDS